MNLFSGGQFLVHLEEAGDDVGTTNIAILRELSFGPEHIPLVVVHKCPPVREIGDVLCALLDGASDVANDCCFGVVRFQGTDVIIHPAKTETETETETEGRPEKGDCERLRETSRSDKKRREKPGDAEKRHRKGTKKVAGSLATIRPPLWNE